MLSARRRTSFNPPKVESEWFSPGRFAALLGLLIVVSFPLVVFGLEAFAYGDSAQFAFPVAFYHRQCFWRGELPLWNPLSSCGMPFLAQWNTMTLYPLSLFYLLLPMPWSLDVFCLGHFFLAGMGMYFLARRWTGQGLAGAVAGAVFAFNGFTWYALMWPHILAGMAWMPWVVLSMELAWRHGRSWILAAAGAAAMQLLSGGAEAVLQCWLVLGAFWLAHFIGGEIPRGKLALRAVGAGALAAGLAAAQVLPFLDLLTHCQRSSAYGGGMMGWAAALPLSGWMNYLVPLFHCVRNQNGVFVQPDQRWVGSYYLGIGTVLLALLALRWARPRRVWLLAGIVLFSVLMAFGPRAGVYDALSHVLPLLGFIRFQVKFLILATFALPLLAGWGLSGFVTLPESQRARGWRSLGGVTAVLLALMGVIVGYAWANPLPDAPAMATLVNAAVRVLFLALSLGCLVGLRARADFKLQAVLQTALVVVLWFDVFTHSSDLSPTVPVTAWEPGAVRQFLKWDAQPRPAESRVLVSKGSMEHMLGSGLPNLQQDLMGRRLALFMNLNLLEGIPKFEGFYALDLKEYFEVFRHLYFSTNSATRLRDFLSISLTSAATNTMDWVARPSALPLVTAGQQPVFTEDAEALQAIFRDDFEPLQRVYLPREAAAAAGAVGPAKVRTGPVQGSGGHLEFEVEADTPALVVVAQAFYHSWQARVDGKPAPLWRANYGFQALKTPAGRHTVSLVYRDAAFEWGCGISLLSLALCVATGLYWRQHPARTPP